MVNGASGEFPANTTPLLRGDLNQDNHVNASDVTAMLTALTDINAYKAAHPTLDTFEASDILDVDQDGIVSNADLQGLLTTLKSGGDHLSLHRAFFCLDRRGGRPRPLVLSPNLAIPMVLSN